ncbi:small GTP-binding protein [Dinoroseobacter shibae DFL 12 = DSM 16493]|jgi:GTP-binding protein|uniref:GTPase Der n=1 Tax=Dinoroseobacter shibae (strain DSM 16493 / NCIMB 14021 / DFL 12) TaxID=398580 RepID=DER_DINSH|nr:MULTISPECIES: ribosome biogenesis GTPase Der [Dinoroseobacter]A8LHW1.1 RecName: Full=GTPase Der; AltName: Full=GTP-binding protein EngA [Dinoroseobacter shibae DFL 12 = DSM 16493]ABV92908.1 small GTP-binding protein [Dinoroseobacter shibae DFL 12 = DSM 16493]MDD9716008.1 ribosome biogenesis GTPase Der [Dinoroseobacter sp. PD6]URF47844.1 ribosome biogenesis GTPase Der [Dinoroseobacter shibae]URF52153.1 ribosome biogenesis GTPase Der [Dinoroseobacter shibae]
MPFTLAIVGRPNVGKSTLFNRLVGKRLALVDDQPGVTRDLREGAARLGDLRFTVIDTAGLEEATDDSLQGRMRRLTERAVSMADACLFLIDARVGVTPTDEVFADILRRSNAHVLLGANKAEGRAAEAGLIEAYALGLGEPLALSAEHGEGMAELTGALMPLIDAFEETENAETEDAPETDVALDPDAEEETVVRVPTKAKPLQVAVVGRPNAGKSTLINQLLGEDRLLTGPEAGITRDAISLAMDWDGLPVRIFDTAGMRKKAKVQEKLEKLSVSDGLRAVKFAEVVVVLLDAGIPFEQQDLRIADLAEREGRAVVIAVNKWDMEDDKQGKLKELKEAFERLLPQLRGAPLVTVSAKTGRGMDRLRDAVLRAHEVWNRRVPTAALNRWLGAMVEAHPPPAPGGRRIKLRYMTQAKTRPPGFVVMCSYPEKIPESYTRYLVNGLREDFDMPGTPIRLTMRSQSDANPYKNRKKSTPSRLRKHLGKPSLKG